MSTLRDRIEEANRQRFLDNRRDAMLSEDHWALRALAHGRIPKRTFAEPNDLRSYIDQPKPCSPGERAEST